MTVLADTLAPPRVLDRDHRSITVGLLALVTMFAFEAVAVSLAMPSVARELDGATLYPIAVVGLLTAAMVGMPVGGTWGDARGPMLPIVAGGAVFVAGLVLSGVAGSMELFVVGRLVQGLGCGAALTAMYVAVAQAYPSQLRTRIFSLFATAWVLPSIAGPFIAGALVDLVGWRSVFLVVAAFAAVSVLLVRGAMTRHLTPRRLPLAWDSRPVWALAAAGGVVAMHVAGHGGGADALGLLLVGTVLVLVAVRTLLPPGTMAAAPGLPAVVATRGLLGAAFACAEMFLPLVLQHETGLSPTAAGLVMMIGALGWAGGSAYSGRRAEPGSFTRVLLTAGLALLGGGLVTAGLVAVDHLTVLATVVATVGFALMAVGMGLATPLLSTLALELAHEGREGESGSAIQMSDALGQSVAAGLVGAVFARWFVLDQDTSYLAAFGLAVVLGALALGVVARHRCVPSGVGSS